MRNHLSQSNQLQITWLGPLQQSINESIIKGCFPKMQRLPQLLPQIKKTDDKNSIKFSSNKHLKLLLKSLRKHTKNTICGKNEQSIFPFYLCVERIVQYAVCAYNTSEEWRKNSDNNNFIGAVLMDLSKAFDCIPHDLVIAKLAAYGFDKNICHIYSYLKKQKTMCQFKQY